MPSDSRTHQKTTGSSMTLHDLKSIMPHLPSAPSTTSRRGASGYADLDSRHSVPLLSQFSYTYDKSS